MMVVVLWVPWYVRLPFYCVSHQHVHLLLLSVYLLLYASACYWVQMSLCIILLIGSFSDPISFHIVLSSTLPLSK